MVASSSSGAQAGASGRVFGVERLLTPDRELPSGWPYPREVSKAFTSEETPDAGPLTRAPPRLAPGEIRYVTPEGYAELKELLARAKEDLARAASLPEGERGATVADVQQRVAVLDATLSALTILSAEAAAPGKVAFGTWVVVEDEEGERTTWRIVGPDEADARRGLVSVHSPMARALLGRKVGDVVEVHRPNGSVELTLLEVRRTAS